MKVTLLILNIVLMIPALSRAQEEFDLSCHTPAVADAGYTVQAKKVEDRTYELTVTEINGWSGNKIAYQGAATLIAVRAKKSCEFQLVDRTSDPQTIIRLIPHSPDMISRLNGKDLINPGSPSAQAMTTLECNISNAMSADEPFCAEVHRESENGAGN